MNYLDDYRAKVLALISKMEFTKTKNEVLPPWIGLVFPHQFNTREMDYLKINAMCWYEKDSWYWLGGEGSKYLAIFYDYFRVLELDEKIKYFKKYDLGPEWVDRDDWFYTLFEGDDDSSEVYEYAANKVFDDE